MNNRQKQTVAWVIVIGVLVGCFCLTYYFQHKKPRNPFTSTPQSPADSVRMALIRYGHQLITATSAFIGPDVSDTSMRYAGNRLDCINCHLQEGRKPFSAPFIGVMNRYPRHSARLNGMISIQDRINECIERNLDGRPLPGKSREMKAIIAYFTWLSPVNLSSSSPPGTGFVAVRLPDRAANINHGKLIYNSTCASCHGPDGQGQLKSRSKPSLGYLYPPLWGKESFTQGSEMHRLIMTTRFIKGNMPFGVTPRNPQLSDAQAYDVAAYINAQTRPDFPGKQHDYPDLTQKPVDCPYPPYPDTLSQRRHQFGPFPAKSRTDRQ